MTRQEFFKLAGFGAAAAIALPACLAGGLVTSCREDDDAPNAPSNVDFTVDVSTGNLSTNGGFMVKQGIVIARTNTGSFLAVSAACTHEGTNVNYNATGNNFVCPNPVSYTHLDVYKRQMKDSISRINMTAGFRTVSYTHLDVYKRQVVANKTNN